jgi:hypothetical protein
MECITAMHTQEQNRPRCCNYFERAVAAVNESSRTAMVDFLYQLSDALSLSRDTVSLAMSLFDRFLSTNTKSASNALASKFNFQLAAITAYYISVKTTEAVELDAQLLYCGRYEKSMILSMEQDILESIEWRTSSPTHLDFMRQVLLLLDFDVY